jgi:hypothetical protein
MRDLTGAMREVFYTLDVHGRLDTLVGKPTVLVEPTGEHIEQHFRLETTGGQFIAEFKLRAMPGCGPIVIAFAGQVDAAFQNRGIYKILLRMWTQALQIAGYKLMLATVVTANAPMMHLLDTHGWSKMSQFVNPATNNNVTLWSVKL